MKLLQRVGVTLGATALAAVGILGATAPDAAAANQNVKNHGTTRTLNVKDSCGTYFMPPGTSRYLSCGSRAAWVPTGWILTKDSVQWRSACNGHPSYWAGFSYQGTTADFRWIKCNG